jgi:uncharacterized protein
MTNQYSKKKIQFLFISFIYLILIDNRYLSQETKYIDPIPLSFINEGSNISGEFFKANKDKPAPTVILVQGFPGRDGDIKGIGSFLKNNNINAFEFNYRGTWKSEGLFSVNNAISDVIKSVEFLKIPDISKKFNIDTTNIALLGYSWGGGIIFLAAKSCSSIQKIISIGTTDLSLVSDKIETDSSYKRINLEMLKKCVDSKIIRGEMTAEESQNWLVTHRSELDLTKTVDALYSKKILFIGGWNDELVLVEKHIIPLYRIFQKRNPLNFKLILFDSDHSFNNVLPELHQSISDWLIK